MNMKHYSEAFKSCSLFGSLRYFTGIRNTVCLIHGPQGCTFFNRNAVYVLNGYNRSGRFIPKIFTTSFTEDDVIFGGRNTLMAAIDEIVEDHHPEYIFLFNCCVTEVIGEDVDGIAIEQANKHNIKIVVIHSAGFKGDHKDGFILACDTLFEEFCQNKIDPIPDSVNILGEFNADMQTSQELRMYLQDAGISVVSCIPSVCTVEELRNSTAAMLNIVYCGNAARRLAMHFEDRYGTPFVGTWGELYGCEAVRNTYLSILNYFHKDVSAVERDYLATKALIEEKKPFFSGKRAIIVSGMKRALGYGMIIKELGVDVLYIYSETECTLELSSEFSQLSDDVDCNLPPHQIRERILEENPDFLFTTLPELVAPFPFISLLEKDYEGFSGIRRMIHVLEDAIKNGQNSVYVTLL